MRRRRRGLVGTNSPGCAEELRTSTREKRVAQIRSDRGHGTGPSFDQAACGDRLRTYFDDNTQQNDLFVPNRNLPDLTRYRLVGVLNGMSLDAHLLVKRAAGKLDPQIAAMAEFDALQAFFREDPILAELSGADLTRTTSFQAASASLETIKQAAKERLFQGFSQFFAGREYDESKPILFAWGRLVNQKAFHVILEAVQNTTLCDNALVIVLATAPAGDAEGMEVEGRLRSLSRKNFVFVNAFDPLFRDTCLLAARGALLTSLFEPCGLTDIEAYWCGLPMVG